MFNAISSVISQPYSFLAAEGGSSIVSPPSYPLPEGTKPKMCSSLYDPEPCCCPNWAVEELLGDTTIKDPYNEPGLKEILDKGCVDCYTVDEWIESWSAAHIKKKESSGFPKSVFDSIMKFFTSDS